ncbi:hypothetical protein UMZ34_00540 [Halopseudomonas pachastrellae]|nr:hypothetical protein UMZ34_00540 [Halopseudomonas pachastrellae]
MLLEPTGCGAEIDLDQLPVRLTATCCAGCRRFPASASAQSERRRLGLGTGRFYRRGY